MHILEMIHIKAGPGLAVSLNIGGPIQRQHFNRSRHCSAEGNLRQILEDYIRELPDDRRVLLLHAEDDKDEKQILEDYIRELPVDLLHAEDETRMQPSPRSSLQAPMDSSMSCGAVAAKRR